jgi:peptidoglycan/LPS O-acetylase OafA/YrhL
MPTPINAHHRYMAGLDGLRAIAVLAVLGYHLNWTATPGGLLGVGVFFVLSGYLITDLLAEEWEQRGTLDLRGFWIRRARRLLPALLVMLLAVTTWITLASPAELDTLRGDILAAVLYISNWWLIFHHVSYFARWGPPTPLGHLWSLAVEEQFYLLWPLLLWWGLRHIRRRGWLVTAVLTLAAGSALAMACLYRPGEDPSRVYYGTDTRAFQLLIGAALALVWPSRRIAARVSSAGLRLLDLAGVVGLVVILLLIMRTTETEAFLYRGGMVLLSLATAALIAALAHPQTRLAAWLGAKPLRWLGVRSYGIYLWHYPIIVLTTPLNAPPDLGRALLQIGASIAAAALSWRFLEDPIRRGRLQAYWTAVRQHTFAPSGRVASAGVAATLATSLSVAGLAGLVPGSSAAIPTVTAILPSPRPHQPPPSHAVLGGRGPRLLPPDDAAPLPPPRLSAGTGVTAVGDSVMIDAAPDLARLLPGIVVDGVVGRQMSQAPAVIQALKQEGDLGRRVFILELGTNGPFSRALLLDVLRDLGPVRHILLVNTRVPRPWQTTVNATLLWAARTYPHTIVVNWYKASAGHPGWFYPDAVHLNPTGAEAYAALIARVVRTVEGGSSGRR